MGVPLTTGFDATHSCFTATPRGGRIVQDTARSRRLASTSA